MTLNLDWLAGALCGWLSMVIFTVHVVSSPKRGHWITLPEYVRAGFLLCGVMFMWRSVNFFSIAPQPLVLGHINAEGMMALIAMTYTISALAFWMVRKMLPVRARRRVEWVEAQERANPDLAPVMMTTADVAKVAKAQGIIAAGPGDPPEALH